MANEDRPYGLVPITTLDGQAPFTEEWPLLPSLTLIIYKGQIVLYAGTTTPSTTTYGVTPNTATCPAGKVVGVAAEYYDGVYANKTSILVYNGSRHIFEIQSDGILAVEHQGHYFALLNPNSGSTVTGHSTSELDSSSIVGTAKTLQSMGLVGRVDQRDAAVAHAAVKVRFRHGVCYEVDTNMFGA